MSHFQPEHHTENLNSNPRKEQHCAHPWSVTSAERQNAAKAGSGFSGSYLILTRPDQDTDLTAKLVKIILCKAFANRKSFGLFFQCLCVLFCFLNIYKEMVCFLIPSHGQEKD